jgi:hypothetical protein
MRQATPGVPVAGSVDMAAPYTWSGQHTFNLAPTVAALNAKDKVRAGTDSASQAAFTSAKLTNLAVNAAANIPIGAQASGLLIVVNNNNGATGIFDLDGLRSSAAKMSDATAKYSTAQGNAGTINVYVVAGVPTVENKTAAVDTLFFTFIGYLP